MTKTIFVDYDGTCVKQARNLSDTKGMYFRPTILPGVKDRFDEWNWKNYKIIIVTGRKESERATMISEINELGLFFDQLIMGLDAGGQRILINNLREDDKEPTALSYNLQLNEGLINIMI